MTKQTILIIAGPNGAGKTTIAPLLHQFYDINEAVNPDMIANGLSLNPQSVAMTSGRIALKRINWLIHTQQSFSYETTLASHTVRHLIEKTKGNATIKLHFMALNSIDTALSRVKTRENQGGHHIPEEVVRRRFRRGIWNFFNLYRDIADEWAIHDAENKANIIAFGVKGGLLMIEDESFYNELLNQI